MRELFDVENLGEDVVELRDSSEHYGGLECLLVGEKLFLYIIIINYICL